MSRRIALFLIVCLAVPALAFAAHGTPKERFNAVDQRKAASIALKRGDFVGGWSRVTDGVGSTDLTCPGFDPDESDLTLTGQAAVGFERRQGTPSVHTLVRVFSSTRDARASWSRSVEPSLARCMWHFAREGVVEAGGKAELVKQGRMTFPKAAPRVAAFRVVVRVTFQQPGQAPTRALFSGKLVVLGHGRGDVWLVAMGFGDGIPAADLRALAKLTAARLAAAKL